jgi:hypothetical protein
MALQDGRAANRGMGQIVNFRVRSLILLGYVLSAAVIVPGFAK